MKNLVKLNICLNVVCSDDELTEMRSNPKKYALDHCFGGVTRSICSSVIEEVEVVDDSVGIFNLILSRESDPIAEQGHEPATNSNYQFSI